MTTSTHRNSSTSSLGTKEPDSAEHHPVRHHLGTTLAVEILGVSDEAKQPADEPGLLEHFSLRGLFEGFAFFELSLWKRPILMDRVGAPRRYGVVLPGDGRADRPQPGRRRRRFRDSIVVVLVPTLGTLRRAQCATVYSPIFGCTGTTLAGWLMKRTSVGVHWQFDALDLRPVERWLAALPTLSIGPDDKRLLEHRSPSRRSA